MSRENEIIGFDKYSISATHYAAPTGTAMPLRLLLAHGAGGNQTSAFIVRWADALSRMGGLPVTTFNFVYSENQKKLPDRTALLEMTYRAVIDHVSRRWPHETIIAGGKSMGGRIATHLAAKHHPLVAGVVVLGYPLRPPDKPDKLRIAHLPTITVPILVVQGENDEFGSPAQLLPYFKMLPKFTLMPVDSANHSLEAVIKRTQPVLEERVQRALVQWLRRYWNSESPPET